MVFIYYCARFAYCFCFLVVTITRRNIISFSFLSMRIRRIIKKVLFCTIFYLALYLAGVFSFYQLPFRLIPFTRLYRLHWNVQYEQRPKKQENTTKRMKRNRTVRREKKAEGKNQSVNITCSFSDCTVW